MIGGGRYQWQWIGRPPIYWTAILVVLMAEMVAGFALELTLSRWASTTRDSRHPIDILSAGKHYYFSPSLGWFINNEIGITFALLGILFLGMFLQRSKVERVH
jgi:hypothetical protein